MEDVTTVAFDLMDTVLRDPYREALEAAVDVPLAELFRRRDASRYPAFERGEISEAEYWQAFEDAGLSVDVEAFHRTRRAGYAWIPGVREVLEDLRGRVRLVTASNYPHWVEEVAADHLDGYFDAVIASVHLGARKPDGDFYVRLCAAIEAAPAEVLFVDDRETNVAGAREVGLQAHHFTNADALRSRLASLGLL